MNRSSELGDHCGSAEGAYQEQECRSDQPGKASEPSDEHPVRVQVNRIKIPVASAAEQAAFVSKDYVSMGTALLSDDDDSEVDLETDKDEAHLQAGSKQTQDDCYYDGDDNSDDDDDDDDDDDNDEREVLRFASFHSQAQVFSQALDTSADGGSDSRYVSRLRSVSALQVEENSVHAPQMRVQQFTGDGANEVQQEVDFWMLSARYAGSSDNEGERTVNCTPNTSLRSAHSLAGSRSTSTSTAELKVWFWGAIDSTR
jgi:hypothetical protein